MPPHFNWPLPTPHLPTMWLLPHNACSSTPSQFNSIVAAARQSRFLLPSALISHRLNLQTKETAAGALRHAVRTLYQGVLYFLNITRFHSTRVTVISFMSTTEVQPSLCTLSPNAQITNSIPCGVPNFTKIGQEIYIYIYSFTLYGCHWTDLHETHAWSKRLRGNSYTEFHESLTRSVSLSLSLTPHTRGRTWFSYIGPSGTPHHSIFGPLGSGCECRRLL